MVCCGVVLHQPVFLTQIKIRTRLFQTRPYDHETKREKDRAWVSLKTTHSNFGLLSLPSEVLLGVCTYLPVVDLIKLSMVNQLLEEGKGTHKYVLRHFHLFLNTLLSLSMQ